MKQDKELEDEVVCCFTQGSGESFSMEVTFE